MTVSLVTLGSLETDELAITIQKSLCFARRIISQWVFVLRSSDEMCRFTKYLCFYRIVLDDFLISISFCNLGISASMNIGIELVKSDFTLIVHSGDSLIDLDSASYSVIKANLYRKSALDCVHVFGTVYESQGHCFQNSNHCREHSHIEFFIPWVPHESIFVPTHFYSQKNYNTLFKSAMDYDLFVYLYLSGVYFKTYPIFIVNFSLGGTSSNLFRSCAEIRRSLVLNNFCGIKFASIFASSVLIMFIYMIKFFFKLKFNFSAIAK